jgi:hypothetical protein
MIDNTQPDHSILDKLNKLIDIVRVDEGYIKEIYRVYQAIYDNYWNGLFNQEKPDEIDKQKKYISFLRKEKKRLEECIINLKEDIQNLEKNRLDMLKVEINWE